MEKNNNNNNSNNNNYNNNNNNNAQQIQSWQNYRNGNGSYNGHMKSDGVESPTNRRWWYTALDVLVFLITCIGIVLRSLFYGIVGRPVKDLRSDIALITGGGAGMGRMLAQRLAKMGTKVVIWDINSAGIKDTVRELEQAGGFCKGYVVDISDREAVYKAADVVRRDVGNVTLLINNAGVANSHYLLDTPDHVIERTFRVNSMAHFWTTKTFLPSMIANGRGHIVTIASIAGLAGVPQLVDYCATKHAAIGFDDALRVELAALNIRGIITTCICPFFMQPTNLFDNISAKWVPILESSDVADRTIRAIQRGETRVVIPWHMNFNIPFKWIFPWQCYLQAQKRMVPNIPQLPVEAATPLPKHSLIFQRPL